MTESYAKRVKDYLTSLDFKNKCCRKKFDMAWQMPEETSSSFSLDTLFQGKCCPSCRSSVVRALFITHGTMTDPSKSFHLDLSFRDVSLCDQVESLLDEEGLAPKRTVRKGKQVLYFKSTSQIEDFLAYIGANSAAFDIMNGSILRDMRNNINRQVNCDTHNIKTTLEAANGQIEILRSLVDSNRLDSLPAELKTTVQLRLENPQSSMQELSLLHDPPISKSGCYHRLQKALSLAMDLAKQ